MKSRSITGRDPATGNVLEVILENGCIRAIIPSPIEEAPWLSPGFIDLQVNGYLGSDANADDVDADVILSLTKKMLALGVTTFLPTVITASEEKIIHALQAIAEARRTSPIGRACDSFCARGRPIHLTQRWSARRPRSRARSSGQPGGI